MDKKEINPEMGQRIRRAINYIVYIEDLNSRQDAAQLLEKDSGNLSKAIKGFVTYAKTYYTAICAKYQSFNKEWFITGCGEMLKTVQPAITTTNNDVVTAREIFEMSRSHNKQLADISDQLKEARNRIDELQEENRKMRARLTEVQGDRAAGAGTIAV